jgi:DNA-directed RNA polymerase specialized sigma24 family protein
MQAAMTSNGYGQAYESGFERTVRFLISRGAQEDRARETAQAAWVQGLECLCQLRDDGMVIAWVNTIALNAFRRLRRREAPMLPLNDFTGGFTVDAAVIDLNTIDVRRALSACRPTERALLEKLMCGVSTKEIASHEGVSETAIRIRLHRARRSARLHMQNPRVNFSAECKICAP